MSDKAGLPRQGAEDYIGDGLYVSFDGWYVRIRTPRNGVDHWIGLEPDTYREFQRWLSLYPRLRRHLTGEK